MASSSFQNRPPESTGLTDYDRRHLSAYLRLLDADAEGADWRDVVRVLFRLDPDREPEGTRMIYDSHLARARWMTQSGYRHLLKPPSSWRSKHGG